MKTSNSSTKPRFKFNCVILFFSDYAYNEILALRHQKEGAFINLELKNYKKHAGFSIWVRLAGGHFGQNGQKLHENCRINILGQTSRGHGGQANFWGYWG